MAAEGLTGTSRRYELDDDSVVVVIGSGAGGATLGASLARRGIDVVCLEAGPRLALGDIVNDEAAMFPRITWLDERIGEGVLPANFPVWNCKTVGGTTMHWTAACPRFQEHEFRARSTYGDLPGASLADWPFGAEDLRPWYERAEDLLGVTGTHGIPYLPANNNYLVMAAGARRIGYRDMDTNHVAINSVVRHGRPPCQQLGFCTSGCAVAAKWCALYTEIPEAEATGHYELRTGCMAVRIHTDRAARATGVEYVDAAGTRHVQRARIVCVAGNTTETTRLLLGSATQEAPNGLANSSGQLGRNYMRHVMAGVVAVMPGPVNMHKGAQCAGIVRDEIHHDPARGFVGGFQMHTVMFTPETLAKLLLPGTWGRRLTAVLEKYSHLAALLVIGEDLPVPDNGVRLHPSRRDRLGLPVPVVRYHHHPNNEAMLAYALPVAERLYRALGAKEVFRMVDVFPSTHNLGTARMGDDPETSVCDAFGRTHDVENLFISDGSVFPTAGCENPTLTIVALALRQADHIAGQMTRGAL